MIDIDVQINDGNYEVEGNLDVMTNLTITSSIIQINNGVVVHSGATLKLINGSLIIYGNLTVQPGGTLSFVGSNPIIVHGCVLFGGKLVVATSDNPVPDQQEVIISDFNCSSGSFSIVSTGSTTDCIQGRPMYENTQMYIAFENTCIIGGDSDVVWIIVPSIVVPVCLVSTVVAGMTLYCMRKKRLEKERREIRKRSECAVKDF